SRPHPSPAVPAPPAAPGLPAWRRPIRTSTAAPTPMSVAGSSQRASSISSPPASTTTPAATVTQPRTNDTGSKRRLATVHLDLAQSHLQVELEPRAGAGGVEREPLVDEGPVLDPVVDPGAALGEDRAHPGPGPDLDIRVAGDDDPQVAGPDRGLELLHPRPGQRRVPQVELEPAGQQLVPLVELVRGLDHHPALAGAGVEGDAEDLAGREDEGEDDGHGQQWPRTAVPGAHDEGGADADQPPAERRLPRHVCDVEGVDQP